MLSYSVRSCGAALSHLRRPSRCLDDFEAEGDISSMAAKPHTCGRHMRSSGQICHTVSLPSSWHQDIPGTRIFSNLCLECVLWNGTCLSWVCLHSVECKVHRHLQKFSWPRQDPTNFATSSCRLTVSPDYLSSHEVQIHQTRPQSQPAPD